MTKTTRLMWLIAVAIIALLIVLPFVALWAIGVVFGAAVPVTFKAWFAALCLLFLFGNPGAAARSK